MVADSTQWTKIFWPKLRDCGEAGLMSPESSSLLPSSLDLSGREIYEPSI